MNDDDIDVGKRRVLIGLTSAVGAVGVAGAIIPFVGAWNPSAKAKAAGAPVQYNISKIESGAMVTVEWRGQPVYIVRRTQEAFASIRALDSVVDDPQSEKPQQPDYVQGDYRSIKDEFLIVKGLCTHLGCAPKYRPEVAPADLGPEWTGGFFCPCHGSKFDLAGRVFKGVPAPTNLEVPPHRYESDDVITIGLDEESV